MGTDREVFEELRRTQFPQLPEGTVYLDWTGAAIPPARLIQEHAETLLTVPLGNTHSSHLLSANAMERETQARAAILAWFNADPDEYEVIFTSGATAAIMLMNHYKWLGGELLLTADNHNSMNGLRELARLGGAQMRYSPINHDLTLNMEMTEQMLQHPRSSGHRLFGMPAKSNYSGTVHSLELVDLAVELGWDVMLDAAAFVSNDRLDLSRHRPHFVPMSFYKMFGYPTGIGCLLIRKDAYKHMYKRWFAGGSILLVSVMRDFHAPEPLGYARFEDGSINFAQIPAVLNGLRFLGELPPIKPYVVGLADMLREELLQLNVNGNHVLVHSIPGNDVVTFSVVVDGKVVPAWFFEEKAVEQQLYTRTGCFCDPGANECAFGYDTEVFDRLWNDAIRPDEITVEQLGDYSDGKPIGAVRASLGYVNVQDDVGRAVDVVHNFLSTFRMPVDAVAS